MDYLVEISVVEAELRDLPEYIDTYKWFEKRGTIRHCDKHKVYYDRWIGCPYCGEQMGKGDVSLQEEALRGLHPFEEERRPQTRGIKKVKLRLLRRGKGDK
jgi:hypothetical protein